MSKSRKQNNLNTLAKYIGMPVQLLCIIGISAYLGLLLDKYFNNSDNYLAAAFAIIALIIYLYKIVITTSQ